MTASISAAVRGGLSYRTVAWMCGRIGMDTPELAIEPILQIEEKVIEGRKEAVTVAKNWSLDGGQAVMVEREDGRVKMSFRDGELVDYVFETRKGRRA